MMCRLCINDVSEYLPIFSENGETTERNISKMIAKYLHFDVDPADELSNAICMECWTTLENFHNFSVNIEEKQAGLRQQIENGSQFIVLAEPFADIKTMDLDWDDDRKNIILSEPQIDIVMDAELTHEFAEADDSRGSESNLLMETTPVPKTRGGGVAEIVKRKYTKRKDKQVKLEAPTVSNATIINREANDYLAQHVQLSCAVCKETLDTFDNLKRHFRREHQCVGYAVCCSKRFVKRVAYVEHLRLHENPELFKCLICKKVLKNRRSLQTHKERRHAAEEDLKFECNICHRKYMKKYILDYHMKRHIVDRDYVCGSCDKSFRTAETLRVHEKLVHLREFSVICDLCGREFSNKHNYEYHMKNVHQTPQQPSHQCSICGNWLKNERSYYKHMQNHEEGNSGKTFNCKICGADKSTNRALQSHVRYHHSDKIFKCTICVKEFKRIRSLEEHMATHTGKDLYTCSFCPQTFKSKANMYSHRKKKHYDDWLQTCANKSTINVEIEIQNSL